MALPDAALPDAAVPVPGTCPAILHDVAFRDLNIVFDHPPDLEAVITLGDALDPLEPGCGAGPAQRAVVFQAPRAGRWHFWVEGGEAAIEALRCGPEATSLGCGQWPSGDLSVELERFENLVLAIRGAPAEMTLRARPVAVAGIGLGCDPHGRVTECLNAACVTVAPDADWGVCGDRPPVIVAGRYRHDPERGGAAFELRVDFQGREPGEVQLEARNLLGEALGPVHVDGGPDPTSPALHRIWGFIGPGAVVPTVVTAVAFAASGERSGSPFSLEQAAVAEPRALGEACDPWRLLSICSDPAHRCVSADMGGVPTCAPVPPAACPAGLEAPELVEGAPMVLFGQAPDLPWVAPCLFNGESRATFTAPVAGQYVFESEGGFGVEVRRGCWGPDVAEELACAWTVDGESSRAAVSLEAGERVFLRTGFPVGEIARLSVHREVPIEVSPPVVRVSADGGRFGVEVAGTLVAGRTLENVRVVLVDEAAAPVFQAAAVGGAAPLVQDLVTGPDGTFHGHVIWEGPSGLLRPAVAARVVVADDAGAQSEPAVVDVTLPMPVHTGQACDPDLLVSVCVDGDACTAGRCDGDFTPRAVAARVGIRAIGADVVASAELTISDPQGRFLGAAVTLWNDFVPLISPMWVGADNDPVATHRDGNRVRLTFETRITSDLGLIPADFTRYVVHVLDRRVGEVVDDLSGEPQSLDSPVAARAGDRCDAGRALNPCGEGLVCRETAEAPAWPSCSAPNPAACPQAPIPMAADADGYAGLAPPGTPRVRSQDCLLDVRDAAVFTFTAPRAGLWRFHAPFVAQGDADGLVSVRRACDLVDPETWACADPPSLVLDPVDVALQAGETVYPFVHSMSPGRVRLTAAWQGP